MQQRPQCTVGEAEVVLVVIRAREIDERIIDATDALDLRRRGRFLDHAAAPAEPEATALLECGLHRRSEAARARLAWLRDAVGDDHQAAHSRLSQLRDRREAALMSPTSE
jgi:hypothetical protein